MRWLISLLLVLTQACYGLTFDELQQRFVEQNIIRANFTQLKTVKGFAKPLQSSGTMLIAKEHGLVWQQLRPFPMQMLLDDKRMVQSINNQTPQVITAESNPQMFQFNHLLRALFQADQAALNQYFKMNFSAQNGKWQLELIPIASPLDKIFSRIELGGEQFLQAIQLFDRQGDLTELRLSDHQLTPTQLSDDEQKLFAIK